MQTGATGIRLVFFLFLLIPGYAAVRSYLWANITLDDTSRLTKLVLMSIGGFASLAIVTISRNVIDFSLAKQLNTELLSAFTINQELTLVSVSNLSILELTTLIVSQSIVAIIGGVLAGAGRVILIDAEREDRQQLVQPWEELFNQVRVGDELTVVTHQGEKVTGQLKQIGNPSREHALILTNPKRTFIDAHDHSECAQASSIGRLSYHDEEDISRVIGYREWTDSDRGSVNAKYMRILQWGIDMRNKATSPKQTLLGIGKTLKRISSRIESYLSPWHSAREQTAVNNQLDVGSGFQIEILENNNGPTVRIEPLNGNDDEDD